jgi:hypothetical protein
LILMIEIYRKYKTNIFRLLFKLEKIIRTSLKLRVICSMISYYLYSVKKEIDNVSNNQIIILNNAYLSFQVQS